MATYLMDESALKVVRLAEQLAIEHSHYHFSSCHLLWCVVDGDVGLHHVLDAMAIDASVIRKWVLPMISAYPKDHRYTAQPQADEWAEKVFNETEKLGIRYGHEMLSALDLFEALVTPNVGFEQAQLRRLPIALYEVIEWREEHKDQSVGQQATGGVSSNNQPASKSQAVDMSIIDKYCDNLSQIAADGRVDPVIGRDAELKQLVEILGKRNSPNVLIVGEPGVGKTAIVGGLCQQILDGQVPEKLDAAVVYALDVSGRLVAGAFRGEVEERLKSLLKAIKAHEQKAILFIDEIHILLDDKGPVGTGVVNLLKPELARGELTVIGATTQTEYQKYIEKDSAFNRRFTRLVIHEPDELLAMEMVQGLAHRYEAFHELKVKPEAISTSVKLAKKYIADKHLPASAIELMDFTMSCASQMNATSEQVLALIKEEWSSDQGADPKRIFTKIKNRLSELLIGRLEEEDTMPENISATMDKLTTWIADEKSEIDAVDIEAITAYQTGIALGQLRSKEQEKLQQAEEILKRRVVGQDHVIKAVARGLKTFRAGLKEAKDPGAIFFFTGPTGTGKTELAKAIAELLFDDEDAMLRFDMSEYQESHSVATLLGAPPGYVGYDEGGILVNNVRKKPYSVVLFDEIEKAHQDIYGIFLQMLTDGRLQDKKGKLADFSNVIIIFTSNAGALELVEMFNQGITPTGDQIKEVLRNTRHFKDEFLGRVDSQILPFKPINEDVARLILDIHLNKFVKLLKRQHNITLTTGDGVKNQLIKIGFSPIYGARPLKNAIKTFLIPAFADRLIGGSLKKGDTVSIDCDEAGELTWDIRVNQPVEQVT